MFNFIWVHHYNLGKEIVTKSYVNRRFSYNTNIDRPENIGSNVGSKCTVSGSLHLHPGAVWEGWVDRDPS